MSELTPLEDLMVNDRYWLQRARGMLDHSIRGRDEAAARLTGGVGWLWTVYTGAALIGAAVIDRPLSGVVVVLLVLAAVALVVAYGLAVWAGLPLDKDFDPRAIEEIKDVHQRATREKRRRLQWASMAAGIGAALVIVAVVATATVRGNPTDPTLDAVVQQEGGELAVLVHGQFPPGQQVTLTVTGAGVETEPVSQLAVADSAGVVQESLPVPEADGYEVRAAWDSGQQAWTLTVQTAAAEPPTST